MSEPIPRRATASPSSPAALVLAGGGARGAYEAGVLHYVLTTFPARSGIQAGFQVFAGTSVGALNASFMAASAHEPYRAGRDLDAYWRAITMERVLRFRTREVVGLWELLLGRRWSGSGGESSHPPVAGIFDTSPLFSEMRQRIPWGDLHANVASGRIRGLALCATEVCTGKATIFHEVHPSIPFAPPRDPSRVAQPVRFEALHAMASSAIPFVFPAIQVDGVCYVDGALHLNTPLMPAIRMGARRILVVSLSPEPRKRFGRTRMGCRKNPYPGAVFLLGRIVDSLMDQTLDHELARLEMFNRFLETGARMQGEPFVNAMNDVSQAFRGAGYHPIQALHIRPSRDLTDVALEVLRDAPEELRTPGPAGEILYRLLLSRPFVESDLTGLILFTPTYARRLLDLGYRDAERHHQDLVRFFGGE